MIIEVCGPPGSGKSTFTKHLLDTLKSRNFKFVMHPKPVLIQKDDISTIRGCIRGLLVIFIKIIPALILNPTFSYIYLKNFPFKRNYPIEYWLSEFQYGAQGLCISASCNYESDIVVRDGGYTNAIASIEVLSSGSGSEILKKLRITDNHYFIYLITPKAELLTRVEQRALTQPREAFYYQQASLFNAILSGYDASQHLISGITDKDHLVTLNYTNSSDTSYLASKVLDALLGKQTA